MSIIELQDKYVAHTYTRFPVAIVSGKGAELTDENGKTYIDMGSGIAVNAFGAADEGWQQAIIAQIGKVQHTSNLYYSEPCAKLAQMLCERTGMSKAFFCNSGAEANECMIKAARRYSFLKYGAGRHTIITLKNSFHGRTITTLAATGQDVFHKDFDPFTEGFVYAEPNDINDVIRLADENACAAVMVEMIQGEGGVCALTPEFVSELAKLCAERDMLFLVDEVQTGNGRTGALYAYMNYGVQPDIFSTAKGIAGGLPLGATLFNDKTQDALTPGTHASTFGGNPVCCAAACYVIDKLTDEFMDEVKEKSEYIVSELTGAKGVKGVTGMGLMLGVEPECDIKQLISTLRDMGLICISAKNKLRLVPPLNIEWEQLKLAVSIIKEALAK